ncbi:MULTISPECIES: L-aspartate oxidase [unclassified Oceanispirochaeta]|uniref:L-aspartate oxidase n=1 Tax=unclassified Oceanispirochaeta TaxID=2635722 RepID=UPI001E3C7FE7|nr:MULTISPECIES: L-aspartate oxidase [unclassified Oceanispirochaeta]
MPDINQFDVIILGMGISGLAAAITASEKGLKVGIFSKSDVLEESNTYYAQGGIVGNGDEDSPELLADDIIKAGDYLNNSEAVDILTKTGPALVDEYLVDKLGINFSKNEDGTLKLTREAVHSVRRIYFDRDITGKAIETGMLDYVKKMKGIQIFPFHMAIDLISSCHHSTDTQARYGKNRIIGAYMLNCETSTVTPVFAGAVILATGGVGNLFQHSSNPAVATGDGIVMAYQAGATVINAEYVQFHPTTLYHRDAENFLISEAVRGEGAVLINKRGEPFMERYNPSLKDLAPRDEVSRAIYMEMERCGSTYVYLDTPRMVIDIPSRFPGIYAKCLEIGIDITKEPIPVVPAAHYFCGGIKVDMNGETSVPGLYAVGETACTGVHGANRLASISLLEGLVLGLRSGWEIADNFERPSLALRRSIPQWIFPQDEDKVDPILIKSDVHSIQALMWNYVGIIRSRKRLARALADLNYHSHRIDRFYRQAGLTRDLVELRNSVLTASVITKAAYNNQHSRGCHYIVRGDAPHEKS